MAAINMLFGTWTGILSVFTVVFATAMIGYILSWAWRKSGQAADSHKH